MEPRCLQRGAPWMARAEAEAGWHSWGALLGGAATSPAPEGWEPSWGHAAEEAASIAPGEAAEGDSV